MKASLAPGRGQPVAGGLRGWPATACWRPTFQPPRGRERRKAGGRPCFSCFSLAASTMRSTHHLHLGRASANVIQRGMAASAVLGRRAASRRTDGKRSSNPRSKPAAPSRGRARDRVAPIRVEVGPLDHPTRSTRTLSIRPQTWVPASDNVGGRWVSNPMGPGLRPVVYKLLSSISVRTRPPAHAPHTPALVPSSTY